LQLLSGARTEFKPALLVKGETMLTVFVAELTRLVNRFDISSISSDSSLVIMLGGETYKNGLDLTSGQL